MGARFIGVDAVGWLEEVGVEVGAGGEELETECCNENELAINLFCSLGAAAFSTMRMALPSIKTSPSCNMISSACMIRSSAASIFPI